MKIISSEIPDVKIIEPQIFGDSRGYFFESYRHEVFEKEIGAIRF
ncbi:MAG: dTDP-4-dehydrorhamnose 3,5-epimerase family protein, partial [Candidatus Aminicenantes bacterium]|nr:dTDP-4-dehydrorhamnose 3,5-epimerase family protein [Candidatus Aminicenantes bacterium]